MKNIIKKAVVLFTLSSFMVGCSSTTVIHSKPEGAKVYLDNCYVGTTPYTHKDMKLVGSSLPLRLTKESYEPLETHLCKDEKADVGAIVGGVFFLFPFLWTLEYKADHTYELVPVTTHAVQQ